METELNKLIDKIKREGVEQAEKDAGEILREAERRARETVKNAEERASSIVEQAQTEAGHFRKNSEQALKRAARDVLLMLRERVTEFFDRIIKEKVSHELSSDALKEAMVHAVENFRKDSELDIEVLVNEKERDKLKKALLSALSKEAKERLTVKGTPAIQNGFRIGEKGKDSYIDFTDEAITEAFRRYLNPRLVEALDIGLEAERE